MWKSTLKKLDDYMGIAVFVGILSVFVGFLLRPYGWIVTPIVACVMAQWLVNSTETSERERYRGASYRAWAFASSVRGWEVLRQDEKAEAWNIYEAASSKVQKLNEVIAAKIERYALTEEVRGERALAEKYEQLSKKAYDHWESLGLRRWDRDTSDWRMHAVHMEKVWRFVFKTELDGSHVGLHISEQFPFLFPPSRPFSSRHEGMELYYGNVVADLVGNSTSDATLDPSDLIEMRRLYGIESANESKN